MHYNDFALYCRSLVLFYALFCPSLLCPLSDSFLLGKLRRNRARTFKPSPSPGVGSHPPSLALVWVVLWARACLVVSLPRLGLVPWALFLGLVAEAQRSPPSSLLRLVPCDSTPVPAGFRPLPKVLWMILTNQPTMAMARGHGHCA